MFKIKKNIVKKLCKLFIIASSMCYAIMYCTVEVKAKQHAEPHMKSKKMYQNDGSEIIFPKKIEYNVDKKGYEFSENKICPIIDAEHLPSVDIQMLNVYKRLAFNDTSDWPLQIKYNTSFGGNSKLKVFVVPHSHNDPGWRKSFDDYYEIYTKSILMNALDYLTENRDMKFIWVEISFFSRFYESLETKLKEKFKKIVNNGQFEFVGGGWVMPDEANTHWYSVLIQLMEGQKWLHENLNVTAISSWAIDPFGHSSTMPFLLKKSGFKNLLIHRTHYAVKKYFAQKAFLEFRWRQLWDKTGYTELFTHMMPFGSYSVQDTCGPDPKICDKFDFTGNEHKMSSNPFDDDKEIYDLNAKKYAELLTNEWRKKANLFKTKSLLVPLGGDFRYHKIDEWKAKHINFKKLFDYINDVPKLMVEVKFATLQEYFNSVHTEKALVKFPTLSGDFFTYSDKKNDYWSGYFTSRPFLKRMERILLHYLHSAEMLSIWHDWNLKSEFDEKLAYARQQLSLFQHHDGITGTSKEYVMLDYERRMSKGIQYCKYIMEHAVYRLLTKPNLYQFSLESKYFHIDLSNWPQPDSGHRIVLNMNNPKAHVVFQNSLPIWREEVVDIYISNQNVQVLDSEFQNVLAQVSFVWQWTKGWFSSQIAPQPILTKFKLTFKIKVPPLGLSTYVIKLIEDSEKNVHTFFPITTILSNKNYSINVNSTKSLLNFSKLESFTLETGDYKLFFSLNGFLQHLMLNGSSEKIPIKLQFINYSVSSNSSGAYLFSPASEFNSFIDSPLVLVSRGQLESSVTVGLPFGTHSIILRNNDIEIRNLIDISDLDETEIAMRILTSINNGGIFYTDLNGFQIMKRKYWSKIPLQGNFYPIPSCIFIEDKNHRVTVLSAQPIGGTSFASGNIELMQDRLLLRDDGRGLDQGISDNKPVLNIFRLLIEKCSNCFQTNSNYPGGFLTQKAYKARQLLLSPINKLIWKKIVLHSTLNSFGESHEPLEYDTELAIIRKLIWKNSNQSEIGVIVHRTKLQKCDNDVVTQGRINFKTLLNLQTQSKVYSTNLTFLKYIEEVLTAYVKICPMDVNAYIIKNII